MKPVLVVVANGSRARIYGVSSGVLGAIASLAHPESRARAAELVSDRPGRAFDETGGPGPHRSGMEPPMDAHEQQIVRFAGELADRIGALQRDGHYPELLLVAPPRFLGHLRRALEPAVARTVVATVSHDYTGRTDAELIAFLHGLGIAATSPSPA